jgi:ribosomal protein S18 acetylase RimI-like enzyme
MEIRNPDKTHLPQVLALLERCFPGRWTPDEVEATVFFDEHYDPNHVWMAREKGQVLGFLHTVQVGSTAWIKVLAVDPEARRRGIGRDLLSRAEFRLSGEGVMICRVESTPPLEWLPGPAEAGPACDFFVACGYTPQASAEAWYLPALAKPAPEPMDEAARAAAVAWARQRSGEHFGWAEEALACRPAKAVFHPGSGLCLADPGRSLGPLWVEDGVAPPQLKALASDAWALASSQVPKHALGLRLWLVPGSGPLPGGLAEAEAYRPFRKTLS